MSNYAERIEQCALANEGAVRLANYVTGASDTNIADAIKTLIDGYGGGSGSEILKIKGAHTKDSAGYAIDTGFHPADVEQFTIFCAFDTDYKTVSGDNYSIIHAMYEASPYPGFTFDLNTGAIAGRFAVGTERVNPVFSHNVSEARNKIAITFNAGTLKFYSDLYPTGYTFTTKCDLSKPTVSFVVGAIKLTNGTYSRYTNLSNIDITCFAFEKSAAECSDFINN